MALLSVARDTEFYQMQCLQHCVMIASVPITLSFHTIFYHDHAHDLMMHIDDYDLHMMTRFP